MLLRLKKVEALLLQRNVAAAELLVPASDQFPLQLLHKTTNFLQKRASNCVLVLGVGRQWSCCPLPNCYLLPQLWNIVLCQHKTVTRPLSLHMALQVRSGTERKPNGGKHLNSETRNHYTTAINEPTTDDDDATEIQPGVRTLVIMTVAGWLLTALW